MGHEITHGLAFLFVPLIELMIVFLISRLYFSLVGNRWIKKKIVRKNNQAFADLFFPLVPNGLRPWGIA
jgi:hypothetical protein